MSAIGREMHDDMSSVSGASFKYNMKNFSYPSSPNKIEITTCIPKRKINQGTIYRIKKQGKEENLFSEIVSKERKREEKI